MNKSLSHRAVSKLPWLDLLRAVNIKKQKQNMVRMKSRERNAWPLRSFCAEVRGKLSQITYITVNLPIRLEGLWRCGLFFPSLFYIEAPSSSIRM